jgi:hypothetical protein
MTKESYSESKIFRGVNAVNVINVSLNLWLLVCVSGSEWKSRIESDYARNPYRIILTILD